MRRFRQPRQPQASGAAPRIPAGAVASAGGHRFAADRRARFAHLRPVDSDRKKMPAMRMATANSAETPIFKARSREKASRVIFSVTASAWNAVCAISRPSSAMRVLSRISSKACFSRNCTRTRANNSAGSQGEERTSSAPRSSPRARSAPPPRIRRMTRVPAVAVLPLTSERASQHWTSAMSAARSTRSTPASRTN